MFKLDVNCHAPPDQTHCPFYDTRSGDPLRVVNTVPKRRVDESIEDRPSEKVGKAWRLGVLEL